MSFKAPQPSAVDVTDRDFVISRVFDAPRALVFKAWTDPTHLARWWGPRGFAVPVCEVDARPGGAYRIVMHGPSADFAPPGGGPAPAPADYPVKGVFIEVVPPERLVMTLDCSEHPDAWHDMARPNRAKGDRRLECVQTVTFEDVAGKTRLTIRTRFESAELRNALAKMGMSEGWSSSLDRLGEELVHMGLRGDR